MNVRNDWMNECVMMLYSNQKRENEIEKKDNKTNWKWIALRSKNFRWDVVWFTFDKGTDTTIYSNVYKLMK